MKLTKKNILKLKYQNNPSILLKAALLTHYKDIFLKVLIREFNFFDELNKREMNQREIVKRFRFTDRATSVFLPLFVEQGYIKVSNKTKKYSLTSLSKEFLISNSVKSFFNFFNFGKYIYSESQLSKDVRFVLKTNNPVSHLKNKRDWITGMKKDKDFAEDFTKALDPRGLFFAKIIAKKLKLSHYKNLIDIGGGSGIYSQVLSAYNKHLNLTILDLPNVISLTRKLTRSRGFSHIIRIIEGDMFNFNYNKKYDVHFYSNVFHDWDKPEVEILIKKSYQGLPKKGEIVIFDGHKELKHNSDSLLMNDINLLMITKGRYYYYYEIKEMLESVGFKKIKKINVYEGRNLIIATK